MYDAAKEGLLKLGDIPGLLQLNVAEQRWDDAFLLLAAHSQLKDQVYLPYAKWLLSQDRCAHRQCVHKLAALALALDDNVQSGHGRFPHWVTVSSGTCLYIMENSGATTAVHEQSAHMMKCWCCALLAC
jgi:hypothetical protein